MISDMKDMIRITDYSVDEIVRPIVELLSTIGLSISIY